MKKLKFLYTLVTIFVTLLFSSVSIAQCTHTFNASGFEIDVEGPLLDGIQIANNRMEE